MRYMLCLPHHLLRRLEIVRPHMAEAAPAETAAPHGRLIHFPVNFFAVVMGLSGLTLATLRLEKATGLTNVISLSTLVVAGAAGALITLLYILKAIRYPQAVRSEWHHPVRLAFFPAASISLLLLATATLPFARGTAFVLWSVGAALHLVVMLAVVAAWIGHRPFEPPHLNPAWFIPAVGNVIVPFAGVPLGFYEISWFFFSVGMMFWVILLTLIFNRLVFHNPLPERLLPTVVILIAPPAAGFIAYSNLNGLDPFARVLFYTGVLSALLVVTQLPKLARVGFSLAWWAYSFPFAALTVATFIYADLIGSAVHRGAALALYALLAGIIALLCVRTILAIAAGKICKPE